MPLSYGLEQPQQPLYSSFSVAVFKAGIPIVPMKETTAMTESLSDYVWVDREYDAILQVLPRSQTSNPTMKNSLGQRLWLMVRDKTAAKLISVVVSILILCLLYRKMDLGAIWEVLSTSSPLWLVFSVGMILPITLLNALRFRWAASTEYRISQADAFAMTVISNAMNLFLPAKLGDLARVTFCMRHKKLRLAPLFR